MFTKLAFVRAPDHGEPLWSGNARYTIPGVSPSHSTYDAPIPGESAGVGIWSNYGGATSEMLGAGATVFYPDDPDQPSVAGPSMTRSPRRGAQFSSLAAMPVFQSFANLRWSSGALAGLIARPDHPALHVDYNKNQQGSKEQQRATIYNPWPSAGALYPKAI